MKSQVLSIDQMNHLIELGYKGRISILGAFYVKYNFIRTKNNVMEAKVKKTGKVVEVKVNLNIQPLAETGATHIYEDLEGNNYLNTELDFVNVHPDWQSLRIQIAKSIIQAIYSSNQIILHGINDEEIAKTVVSQTDALIKELKRTM